MRKSYNSLVFLIVLCFSLSACSTLKQQKYKKAAFVENKANLWLDEVFKPLSQPHDLAEYVRIDSIEILQAKDSLIVFLSPNAEQLVYREQKVNQLLDALAVQMKGFYDVDVRIKEHSLSYYIPNAFLSDSKKYLDRYDSQAPYSIQDAVVIKSDAVLGNASLAFHNIALWHSHGWHYDVHENRWAFQRPRLFGSVEDLLPTRFVLNYLTPMLENAGAAVWLPRERDLHKEEYIFDFDNKKSRDSGEIKAIDAGVESPLLVKGFAIKDSLLKGNINPFTEGTALVYDLKTNPNAEIRAIVNVDKSDFYALYIAYPKMINATTKAKLEISNGTSSKSYFINQTKAYATWVYVDDIYFDKDANYTFKLSSLESDRQLGFDAFRIGGGIGNIKRGESASGKARYTEGSRYWLQYAGFADSLVYSFREEKTDYVDDFVSRGEWVNQLVGNPSGPNQNRKSEGLNVPIQLSLAFHTDAGVDEDKTIGTLAIYSTEGAEEDTIYPNGENRSSNRDLADLVQSEIVNDIRVKYDSTWARRALKNAKYSEAYRPNVPSMLLELLSHQNYKDMMLANDPTFQFDVSRAIYKGIARFIAERETREVMIAPLAPIAIESMHQSNAISLKWKAASDTLSKDAEATKFIVEYGFGSEGDYPFHKWTHSNELEIPISTLSDSLIRFRIKAWNEGGFSMPSEEAVVLLSDKNTKEVLIVNLFDKLSGPTYVDAGDYLILDKEGMPFGLDPGYTGEIKNLDKRQKWVGNASFSNSSPGFGDSYSSYDFKPTMGNSFNYPSKLAALYQKLGYQVEFKSKDAFLADSLQLKTYDLIHLIGGAQSTYTLGKVSFKLFDEALIDRLKSYQNKSAIFLSAKFMGEELNRLGDKNKKQLSDIFGFQLEAKKATKSDIIMGANKDFGIARSDEFYFVNQANDSIYFGGYPNAIMPAKKGVKVLTRFKENEFGAAVLFNNTISTTVPIEIISDKKAALNLLNSYLKLLFKAETNTESH